MRYTGSHRGIRCLGEEGTAQRMGLGSQTGPRCIKLRFRV